MPAARSFTELQYWQRARIWSKDIFAVTQQPPFSKDQRLVAQINDSSESVMSNMAEGFGRGTQEEFITFLGYALGSLDETKFHLCAAYDRRYVTKDQFATLFREGTEIRKLTIAFLRSMTCPVAASARSARARLGRTKPGKSTNALPANRAPKCSNYQNLTTHVRRATTTPQPSTKGTQYFVLGT
jgi:four helix bundle protein